jgi:osmotically inducible protein OsmC
MGLDTTDAQVSASVALVKTSDIAYGISVELDVYAPKVPADQRQQLADGAHQVCPYSNATRGNVDVKLTIVD